MNYSPEQLAQAVIEALKFLDKPDLSNLTNDQRIQLAKDKNTPPETLARLTKDKEWDVRWEVARNPNTPPEVLASLANDKIWNVRWRVVINPNTPPGALARLADDKKWDIRERAMNHPNYNSTETITLTKRQKDAIKRLIKSSQDESLKDIVF